MSDATKWDLLVGRDEPARTEIMDVALPDLQPDEVLLRVDRVGITANNVTYALLGNAMNYWAFFPAEEGWGRVPLWGFADVEASNVPGVDVGARFYGYLPTSSHLVVRPTKIGPAGFRDSSEHRAALPGPYNIYAATDADPGYAPEYEDLQILYRPLFITSFMLDDFLDDNAFFGAETVVMSSASSKTAYGTAFCVGLRDRQPKLVGLTSPGNLGFTEELGCYDEVLAYADVMKLPADTPTLYADFAGSTPLRSSIHEHLGDRLTHDAIIGATHLEESALQPVGELPGPAPQFFFAPDQIRKRRADWGPGGIEERFGVTWARFVPTVEKWVDVQVGSGSEGLRSVWLEVLAGRSDPRAGNVIKL